MTTLGRTVQAPNTLEEGRHRVHLDFDTTKGQHYWDGFDEHVGNKGLHRTNGDSDTIVEPLDALGQDI